MDSQKSWHISIVIAVVFVKVAPLIARAVVVSFIQPRYSQESGDAVAEGELELVVEMSSVLEERVLDREDDDEDEEDLDVDVDMLVLELDVDICVIEVVDGPTGPRVAVDEVESCEELKVIEELDDSVTDTEVEADDRLEELEDTTDELLDKTGTKSLV